MEIKLELQDFIKMKNKIQKYKKADKVMTMDLLR